MKHLSLTDNALTEIPESFRSLTALRKLSLKQNRLKSLPEGFFGKELCVLDLSNNQLGEVSPTVFTKRCVNLQELDISGNCLRKVSLLAAQIAVELHCLELFAYHPQQEDERVAT